MCIRDRFVVGLPLSRASSDGYESERDSQAIVDLRLWSPRFRGIEDDESVFGGSSRTGDRSGRGRGDAASGGGPVQGERKLGDPLGGALAAGLGNRRQAAGRQRLAAGGTRGGAGRLGGRTTGPDDEFCAVLQERKIATSRVSVWRFFSRHGLSFKKNPARQRAGAGGRGRGAAALARGSALA